MSPVTVVIFVYLMVQIRTSMCLTQVEIGCPIYMSTAGGNGALAFHGPAFETAVKECNRMYTGVINITLTFIVSATFEETFDNFANDISRWYLSQRRSSDIAAVISPGSMDPTPVHQLTSHWNIICLSTMRASPSAFKLRPATTMIASTFVSIPSIVGIISNLLWSHRWITVFLVVDRRSVPAYITIAEELERVNTGKARFLKRYIQAKELASFDEFLREFKRESRVMIFLGRENFIRRLMVDAAALNMTNGEFVYLCDGSFPNSRTYGDLQWRIPGEDAVNQMAREAFRSLLLVHPYETTDIPAALKKSELVNSFRLQAKQRYNVNMADQVLPEILSSYVNIFMFAQILNETLVTFGEARLHDGQWLSERFLKRAFIAPGGLTDIYVDENGFRQAPLAISYFEGKNSTREVVFIRSHEYGPNLWEVRNISATWPGAMWPPVNEPLCGYTGMKEVCRESAGFLRNGGLIGLLTTISIAAVLAMIAWTVRSYLSVNKSRTMNWRLDGQELAFPGKQSFTTFSTAMSQR
ncbi:hypothetical protein BV898_11236 [Hypsibius exemplaris]|uniref:Receptor ligand binding region domain-containing protein n=1 Tax=Hypsibius exemplaris TaxID=2072580 RepID=A0A1W0WH40_HYPEX|nr:hypothetical protein BV898_11236 [Hypsibius exemplaris]